MSSIFSTIKSIFQAYVLPAQVTGEQNAAAKSLVEEMIGSNKVAVFSKSYCPYCVEAKELLSKVVPSESLKTIELDHEALGPAIQAYLAERIGANKVTVPQIYIKEDLIGGCSDLKTLERQNKLAPLLAAI